MYDQSTNTEAVAQCRDVVPPPVCISLKTHGRIIQVDG